MTSKHGARAITTLGILLGITACSRVAEQPAQAEASIHVHGFVEAAGIT